MDTPTQTQNMKIRPMIAAIGRINCFTKPCVTQAGFWFYKRRSEPQHQLPVDFLAVLLIDAQHAPADRAGQLIGDGTGQSGQLVEGVMGAEHLHLVAHIDVWQVRQIDHAHIHADPAALGRRSVGGHHPAAV